MSFSHQKLWTSSHSILIILIILIILLCPFQSSRAARKAEMMRQHMKCAMMKSRVLTPCFGRAMFFEVTFTNPHDCRVFYRIEIHDPLVVEGTGQENKGEDIVFSPILFLSCRYLLHIFW